MNALLIKNTFKLASALLIGWSLSPSVFSQSANDIAGYWVTQENDAVVRIDIIANESHENSLELWLVATLDPELKDTENPDPKLQQRLVSGTLLGSGFIYNRIGWRGGEIYDPGSGNTYKGRLRLEDFNHINLRGYAGISLLGRTTVWTRLSLHEKHLAHMLRLAREDQS